MALLKDVATNWPSITAGYHIITAVPWVKDQPYEIQMASWANEADRRASYPVALGRPKNIRVSASAEPPTLAAAYVLVKASPDWFGATDG